MLTRISVSNYGVLGQVELPLGPLTVLVGPNGSGKSTTLKALRDAFALTERRYQEELNAWGRLGAYFDARNRVDARLTKGSAGPLRVDVAAGDARLAFAVDAATEHWTGLGGGWLRWSRGDDHHEVTVGGPDGTWPPADDVRNVVNAIPATLLGSLFVCNHVPAALAAPCASASSDHPLQPDGAGLAAALAVLLGRDDGSFAKVVEQFRMVIPAVEKVLVRPTSVQETVRELVPVDALKQRYDERFVQRTTAGWEVAFRFARHGDISADQVSDGTLLALGLLTELAAAQGPTTVFVDDIDRGLHPTAQAQLVQAIREIQRRLPELQVIVTTHSPYLLDHFTPEEVIVLALDRTTGLSRARALTDHRDAAKLRGSLETGEFWSAVGEDWVLA